VPSSGAYFDMSSRLEYFCTHNQTRYEVLIFSLEILESMGVKHVEAFADSLLIVQQVSRKYQCLDGSLNAYLDKCLDVIAKFDEFSIHHIYWHENNRVNDLAQETGNNVSSKNFNVTKRPMLVDVQNVDFMSDLGTETGLTGGVFGLTSLPDAQTGLIGLSVSINANLVPQIDNLAIDNLKVLDRVCHMKLMLVLIGTRYFI
jgi:ribonuclease HI